MPKQAARNKTPETPAEKRRRDAQNEVDNAVVRLVAGEAAAAGPSSKAHGFEVRAIYPGSTITRRFPLPGPDLRASMAVLYAAREQVRRAIDNARGSGMSWDEIGHGLGFEQAATRAGMELGRAAGRFAAMGVFPGQPDAADAWTAAYGPAARWRCRSCQYAVSEADIDSGVSAQRGHAPGCARYAAEVADEQRRCDDERDNDDEEYWP